MNWHIQWSRNAIKDMQKLDKPLKDRIWDSLNSMTKQPQLSDIKKLKGKTISVASRAIGELGFVLISLTERI